MENNITIFDPTEQYRNLLCDASRDVGQVTDEQWKQLGGKVKNASPDNVSYECKRTQMQKNLCQQFLQDNVYCKTTKLKVLTLTMEQQSRLPRGQKYIIRGPYRLTRGIVSLSKGQMAVLPLKGTADQNARVTCYCSTTSPIGSRAIQDWKDAKPVLIPAGGCMRLEEGEVMFLVIQCLPKEEEEGSEAVGAPQVAPPS